VQHPELVALFTTRLDAARIPYMITGSVAAMLYGEPRFTNDLDVVLRLSSSDIEGAVAAFPDAEFYCPPAAVIALESKRPLRGHFDIIHRQTGYRADVYLMRCDPLHEWGMAHRKRIPVEARAIWLAPPEYVIVRKLEYFREGHSEKHLLDIAGMLAISGGAIDMPVLDRLIAERGLQGEWQQAQRGKTTDDTR
jgi:hypothetical protein